MFTVHDLSQEKKHHLSTIDNSKYRCIPEGVVTLDQSQHGATGSDVPKTTTLNDPSSRVDNAIAGCAEEDAAPAPEALGLKRQLTLVGTLEFMVGVVVSPWVLLFISFLICSYIFIECVI